MIANAAHEVTSEAVKQANGSLFLIPSSSEVGDISRILQEGYDIRLLKNGFRDLVRALNLDYVFVDTDGKVVYSNAWVTDHDLTPETVPQVARAGRSR